MIDELRELRKEYKLQNDSNMSDMVSNYNKNRTNGGMSDNASGVGNNYFSARHRSNNAPESGESSAKPKKNFISRNKYATNFNSSIVSGEGAMRGPEISENDNFSVSNYNKS